MDKKIIIGFVLLGVLAIGAYLFPSVPEQLAGSAAGSTFNTAYSAGVIADLSSAGSTGTSTSILNTDSGDRFVTNLRIGCSGVGTSQTAYTGAGLAALLLNVGTSSTASPASLTSVGTFARAVSNFTMATNTSVLIVSSTTPSVSTSTLGSRWKSGEYLSFVTNATNTAVCNFSADYLKS